MRPGAASAAGTVVLAAAVSLAQAARAEWPGLRRRVPGVGRSNARTRGGWGQCRPGLSCSTTRLPSHLCRECWHALRHPRGEARPGKPREPGTPLVRALALHGVARPICPPVSRAGVVRLRSHLASPLVPGRGVLIRSVSRRLGSVACVREDASPNEVSLSTTVKDARSGGYVSILPAGRRRAEQHRCGADAALATPMPHRCGAQRAGRAQRASGGRATGAPRAGKSQRRSGRPPTAGCRRETSLRDVFPSV